MWLITKDSMSMAMVRGLGNESQNESKNWRSLRSCPILSLHVGSGMVGQGCQKSHFKRIVWIINPTELKGALGFLRDWKKGLLTNRLPSMTGMCCLPSRNPNPRWLSTSPHQCLWGEVVHSDSPRWSNQWRCQEREVLKRWCFSSGVSGFCAELSTGKLRSEWQLVGHGLAVITDLQKWTLRIFKDCLGPLV